MRILLYIVLGLSTCLLAGAVSLRALCARDRARVAEAWEALGPAGNTVDPTRFDPASLEGLPDPARRYLEHAIQPGTPLASLADLTLSGELLLDESSGFAPFDARHRISPGRGYVWQAEVAADGLRLSGAETLVSGVGRSRFWWHDFVPSGDEGDDLDRSLCGRLAVDRVFLPPSLLPSAGVTWTPVDERRAAVTFEEEGHEISLVIEVADDGSLVGVRADRWSNRSDDHDFTVVPYGCRVHEERTFEGMRVPARLSYFWWLGTDREQEFARVQVTAATFR